MPIVKKYVTWKAKKINDFYYQHPNTNGRAAEESNGDINFIETPYQSIDGTYMGIAEHDGSLPQARLDALMIVDPEFQLTSVTEGEINQFLLENYGSEMIGEVMTANVGVCDHIFTDNRPQGVI